MSEYREPRMSKPSKGFNPFDEDKHVMSREPVSDYGFVFIKWVPGNDHPSFTDWQEVGDQIEFQAVLRTRYGPARATHREPKLETKDGKAAFTARVRDALVKGLQEQMAMMVETK